MYIWVCRMIRNGRMNSALMISVSGEASEGTTTPSRRRTAETRRKPVTVQIKNIRGLPSDARMEWLIACWTGASSITIAGATKNSNADSKNISRGYNHVWNGCSNVSSWKMANINIMMVYI